MKSHVWGFLLWGERDAVCQTDKLSSLCHWGKETELNFDNCYFPKFALTLTGKLLVKAMGHVAGKL